MVIYKITNLINGKQYIGRDSKNNPNYYGSGPAIKNAIKKYGKENFKKEIIEHCENINHLMERERYWLEYYDVGKNSKFYNLHNLSFGGSLAGENHPMFGKHHSSESIQKMRNVKIGKTASAYTKAKLSKLRTGEKNNMFGKKHSIETRKKMSNTATGKYVGEKNPMYGKGYLLCGDKNGKFNAYVVCIFGDFIGQRKTAKEWSFILGVRDTGVHSHLRGDRYKNGIKGNFFQWEKKE
jgi:group I intron endonuclease